MTGPTRLTATDAPQKPPSPAHSPAAEQALLGACLISAAARDVLRTELEPADFYLPAHQRIADTILELHQVDNAVDARTVAIRLVERYGKGALTSMGGEAALITLMVNCPATGGAATYAATIRDRASRRRLKDLLQVNLPRVDDLATAPEELAETLTAGLRSIEMSALTAGTPPDDIGTFLNEDIAYDWCVPGLLERGDRLIITGGEGAGKSVTCRQLALQFAAGIHPFARMTFPPVTVLAIDLENSRQQLQRGYAGMIRLARPDYAQASFQQYGHEWDPNRLRIEVRRQGLDLLTRTDRQWFARCVELAQPDVIITGPIYKMHRGDPKDEQPAATVAFFLDELRARHGCAIILEAHSPHGQHGHRDLRPIGASLWMRWPEFGYGLTPLDDDPSRMKWVAWRGARDDNRQWARVLRRGGPNRWPWVNDAIAEPEEEAF